MKGRCTINDYEREMLDLYKKSLKNDQENFKGIVCPTTYGEDKECPLCEMCKEVLWDKTIAKEDPLRERASNMNRKKRFYSNIYFASNPTEVVVFEYGDKIFNQLLAGQMDELSEWKNFFDPKNGCNLLISKTQGATKKQVDYYVEARRNSSPIIDPSVLSKMFNLDTILELMDTGKVKPFYQSKFQAGVKTEIRILPSWLGPGVPKFFSSVIYHYVNQDEFTQAMARKFNPVKKIPLKPPTEMRTTVTVMPTPSDTGTMTWPDTTRQGTQKQEEPKKKSVDDILAKWGLLADDDGAKKEEQKCTTEKPACWGDYDEDSPECTTECRTEGWSESCAAESDRRKELRRAARKLQR